jgi:hypothetical protein
MPYDLNSAAPQSETAEQYEAPLTDEEREEYERHLEGIEAEYRYEVEHQRVVELDEAAERAFVEANLTVFEEHVDLDDPAVAEKHDRTALFFTGIAGFMTAAREHYGNEVVDVYLRCMFPVPWPNAAGSCK